MREQFGYDLLVEIVLGRDLLEDRFFVEDLVEGLDDELPGLLSAVMDQLRYLVLYPFDR